MTSAPSRGSERPRLLALLARHLLAISRLRLRALFERSRPSWDGRRPLRAAFLAVYPEHHYGTVFRLSRWIPHLARRGIEVELLCSSTEEEWDGFRSGEVDAVYCYHRGAMRRGLANLRRAAAADVVLMHRGLLPFGPWQRPSYERILAKANPRIVYDFYDSIWALRRGARGRAARWLNPPDLVDELVGLAAAVTVSNEHLAEWARARHPDVRRLPMVVEPSDYPRKEHGNSDPVVLGWMGGPQNLERLVSIGPALARAASEAPIRVRTVSPRTVEIPGVDVECRTHPWTPESEAEDLLAADVGLLPMFDDDQDRGKSPLKLLQYAAAGLPIVTSPVAVDFDAFRPGESILVADSEEEWAEAIVALARDPALRQRLGRAARKVVESRFSFEAHVDGLAEVLEDVAARPAPGGAR